MVQSQYRRSDSRSQESDSLIKAFFADVDLAESQTDRISHVVGHHHTYEGVNGRDWQILLEADYIVNASENGYTKENIRNFLNRHARTIAGKRLIQEVFCL